MLARCNTAISDDQSLAVSAQAARSTASVDFNQRSTRYAGEGTADSFILRLSKLKGAFRSTALSRSVVLRHVHDAEGDDARHPHFLLRKGGDSMVVWRNAA